jgi:S-adenosylmethionine-diacylgycerolhomoserine-N-methlytransferase
MDITLQDRLDGNYRYQRHVYDLTREYYLLGRDRLIAGLAPPEGGSVLEVGCGTARNLIQAAKLYPHAQLFGIDLSRMMLETAQHSLAQNGLAYRVHLAHADATTFDPVPLFGYKRFDRIFFSYSVSMIPPWRAALAHAVEHLAPGGSLHLVDFGRGEGLPAAANRVLRAWLSHFHVTPRDDIEGHLRDLGASQQCDLYFSPRHRGYSNYAVLAKR